MKFDVTKLPLGEALIGFVTAAVAVTFVLAFVMGTDNGGIERGGAGGDGAVADTSPTPEETPSDGETPDGGGETFAVSMGDNLFEANEFTVAAGSTVTFDLTNDGLAIHNMHVAGADNDYGAPFCKPGEEEPCSDPELFSPGDSGSLTFSSDEAGSFIFRCDFHPTQMVGEIVVE